MKGKGRFTYGKKLYDLGIFRCNGQEPALRFCKHGRRLKDLSFRDSNFAGSLTEDKEYYRSEMQKRQGYYLMWFVYRHVLGCDTLEKAKEYATEEILRQYRLWNFIWNSKMYVGIKGINEMRFWKVEDMAIILEILYYRYEFFEQMECFIRNTSNMRQARCKKAFLECQTMMGEAHYRNLILGEGEGA